MSLFDCNAHFTVMDAQFATIKETILQRAIHVLLCNQDTVWKCTNGDTIQIVAAGIVNVMDGPDFTEMAILHNGRMYVGHGEFHRRSSEWIAHGHDKNKGYRYVLVHWVLVDEGVHTDAQWTVVVDAEKMRKGLEMLKPVGPATTTGEPEDIKLLVSEVQRYALLRLLRHTMIAQSYLDRLTIGETLMAITRDWIDRMILKKHRPWQMQVFSRLSKKVEMSEIGRMALYLDQCKASEIYPEILSAEQSAIAGEGLAIRRELLVNVIIPVMVATATREQKIPCFQWYWSVRSIHVYGLLRRRFPGIPQTYVWQQQGMLEFMREHGRRTHATLGETAGIYGVCADLELLCELGPDLD